jgi:hypothetical protein
MTWTQFDRYGSSASTDSTVILFSKSTDAGESWSNVLRINKKAGDCVDEDNTVEGAVPCTGPNGEIYTSWSGPLGLVFDKSIDGGTTWLPDDKFVTDQPGGWDYAIPGIYRANGLPVTSCDVSNGPYRGNIYINWTDQRNGTLDTDVWMIKSTDGGNTWGTVKRVNDDPPGKQQFFTWMTIDQVTGHLYFVFYDRRNYTGNQTDVYMAKSTDGGETFTNFKVSESPFTPSSSTFFGDYTNITAHAGIVRPIWARLSGSMSIYTAIVDFPTGIVKINTQAPETFRLYENYPNPFNPTTKIKIGIPAKFDKSKVTLHIFDMSGREVNTLVDSILESGTYEVLWDATGLPSGVYYCKMTAGRSGEIRETIKMLLVK